MFAKRQAERDAEQGEQQDNLARKSALCEQVESWAEQSGGALLQMRSQVQDAQQHWTNIGHVPKNAFKALEKRFARACDQFENRCQQQLQLAQREELNAQRQRAALCMQLEALLEQSADATEMSTQIEHCQHQWQQLPALRATLETPLRQRFDQACAALNADEDAQQQYRKVLLDNHAQKRELCLRLEIVTETETPAEYAQERMNYQVSRLSESMQERRPSTGSNGLLQEALAIEQRWYTQGSLPAAAEQALDARVQRAVAAL